MTDTAKLREKTVSRMQLAVGNIIFKLEYAHLERGCVQPFRL